CGVPERAQAEDQQRKRRFADRSGTTRSRPAIRSTGLIVRLRVRHPNPLRAPCKNGEIFSEVKNVSALCSAEARAASGNAIPAAKSGGGTDAERSPFTSAAGALSALVLLLFGDLVAQVKEVGRAGRVRQREELQGLHGLAVRESHRGAFLQC